jgi:hypothetical protein
MNWNKKIPLSLFLLITAAVSGVIFVLAAGILSGSLIDTVSFTDSITSALGIFKGVSDSASFTDSITSALGIFKGVSDSASFTDSITSALGIFKGISDTASFTDSITSALGIFKPPLTQTLSFSELLDSTLHISNATLTSTTGTGNITVSPSAGTVLTSVSAQPVPPGNPPPVPSGAQSVNLPHGLIAFEANTTTTEAVITIQYPSLPPLQSNQYLTYFKLVGTQWKEVKLNDTSNTNGYFTLSGTTVTLHIKDNGDI